MSKLPSKLNNLRQINNRHGFSVLILFEITKDKLVTGMVSRFSFCLKLTPTFFLVDSVAARMRLPSYSPPCELKGLQQPCQQFSLADASEPVPREMASSSRSKAQRMWALVSILVLGETTPGPCITT